MKHLHARVVWLFFTSFLLRWGIIGLFVAIFLGVGGFMKITQWMFRVEPSRDAQDILSVIVFSSAGIVVLIIFFILFLYIWAQLSYRFYRYELTESGFKKEHGVIWKKYVFIPYNRIQNIDIYRGLISRLLGLSDLQIQTAGGITAGSYGAYAEGRLPGLAKEDAERLRDELVQRTRQSRSQGL